MNKNIYKYIFWISTLILCGIMAMSASMYLTKYDMVKGFFTALGYPTYIIYPLAVAKILGIIAILTRKSNTLKEWAYAGFFFDMVLAWSAHYHNGDGVITMALYGLIALVVSKVFEYLHFNKTL